MTSVLSAAGRVAVKMGEYEGRAEPLFPGISSMEAGDGAKGQRGTARCDGGTEGNNGEQQGGFPVSNDPAVLVSKTIRPTSDGQDVGSRRVSEGASHPSEVEKPT